MITKQKYFFNVLFNVCAVVFAILGALNFFFPFSDVNEKNIIQRVIWFIGTFIVLILISGIYMFIESRLKTRTLYSKGKTGVAVQYGDIAKLLESSDPEDEEITVVVPVNTGIQSMFDLDKVKKMAEGSVHYTCLKYMLENKSESIDLNERFIEDLEKKKIERRDESGLTSQIGDWFLISGEDIGINRKIQFFFLIMYDYTIENGFTKNKYTNESYLKGLQSLFDGISNLYGEEKVYIPLIGAGRAQVKKEKDVIASLLVALTQYNIRQITQKIHIIIRDTDYARKEVPIYLIPRFSSYWK